jgi:cytochrome c-type biogenesis protein CcmH/NrfG
MKEFFKSLADYVFSFGMFMFLFVVGVVLLMSGIVAAENKAREQTQKITEACYSQGMVLVHSDAGQRCVLPQSLVKVK